jgi:hypothetical protein
LVLVLLPIIAGLLLATVVELLLIFGPIVLGRGRPLLDIASPLPTRLRSAETIPPKRTAMRYAIDAEFPSLPRAGDRLAAMPRPSSTGIRRVV